MMFFSYSFSENSLNKTNLLQIFKTVFNLLQTQNHIENQIIHRKHLEQNYKTKI